MSAVLKISRRMRKRSLHCRALALFASLLLLPWNSCVAANPSRANPVPPLLLGAAWYPEQWPEQRWDADLALMEAANIRVARIGEFAWGRLEPTEGQYHLDWMERAIRDAERHHILIVIGTPTDAPPAWLTQEYPETLRVDAQGIRTQHGGRRQFSYSNPKYRVLCRRIVGQLALRFGHDPDVIGWQIGNEYTDESFDAETRRMFQQWLEQRYKTLDALNAHWTTAYWSQTYSDWNQIPLSAGPENPGLMLEHRHFVSDTWRSFQHNQIDAIRHYADPQQFITTNLGGLGWSANFDHYEITEDLDLASWDDYVGEGHLHPYKNGAMHDFVRGWKRKNFWVMETQPGSVNWAPVNNSLDKGETRAMAWEAIGHGADAVLYWQWRDALNGQEEYHGAIVGPDGRPLPIYSEIQQIGREFALAAPVLQGTRPVSQVAILYTYDSRWAIDFQRHTRDYDQLQVLLDYYRPLRDLTQSVDIVSADAPLDRYKLVVAPSLNVISQGLADHLKDYVRRGGHLVFGPRSGMKNGDDALNMERQPGPLGADLGARVSQYYALENSVPIRGIWGQGHASIWAEPLSIHAKDVRVLLRYGKSNGWLDGRPAMVVRNFGNGQIAYLGTILDASLMRHAAQWMIAEANVRSAFGVVPPNVEVCRRERGNTQVFIFINHGEQPVAVPLPSLMRNWLEPGPPVEALHLDREGVAVVSEQASATH